MGTVTLVSQSNTGEESGIAHTLQPGHTESYQRAFLAEGEAWAKTVGTVPVYTVRGCSVAEPGGHEESSDV